MSIHDLRLWKKEELDKDNNYLKAFLKLDDSRQRLISEIQYFFQNIIEEIQKILKKTEKNTDDFAKLHTRLIKTQERFKQMKNNLIEIVNTNLLNDPEDPLIVLTKKYLSKEYIDEKNIIKNYNRRNAEKKRKADNNAGVGPVSKKKPVRGGFKKTTQRNKKKLTHKVRK